MRKWILAFFIGGVLGTAFGVAVGFFAFPYVFPPPPAMEVLAADENSEIAARGTFIHANPSDPIHYGEGSVTVYEKLVFLEEDFKVGPGPAFHVYLVPHRQVRESADVKGTMYIDLGKLRAFSGSQNYPIPDGVDLDNYPSVVIWCAEFGVLISPADLAYET